MLHRGPDGHGLFADAGLCMGMQRLAIIDVDGGQQPLYNETESIVTVCNGEIYNFRELREELTALGHRFRTGSDCEVIVHLYEEYGDEFVTRLSGMFGLALWDKQRQRLLLARDRLGIKPLYLYDRDGLLVFASELKSILDVPAVPRQVNRQALQEYLILGYVPAPMSMLDGITKVEPGTLKIVEGATTRTIDFRPPKPAIRHRTQREWAEEVVSELEASVTAQMVSDVPLGAFLSGGVDSSAVVALMARNSGQPVKTYSIGFDSGTGGSYYNELPYARQVAERFDTDHREIVVRPDVTSLLPDLLWHLDEPIADAAFITTYLVSKFAREDVTVILSGVGGDELFGGYRRYWGEHLLSTYRRIPGFVRKGLIQPVGRRLPSDRHSRMMDWARLAKGFLAGAEMADAERYENFVGVFHRDELSTILEGDPESSPSILQAAFLASSADDPVQRLIDVDMVTQLPDDLLMLTDRMSMATSLECRVPLLDDRLVNVAASMPSDMKVHGTKLKYVLKEALRGVLPDEIIDRKKRGFGAPIGGWFKKELVSYLDTVLSERTLRDRGLFDYDAVSRLRADHDANREDHTDHLLALLNFELWSRIYLDGESRDDVAGAMAEAGAA